jgi:thioesterase domain-containing protein/aryl carrier-like protein
MIREDHPDDKRLTAYWIARPGYSTTSTELRTHLSSCLPDYMVPSAFVALESLPLNANGKIDRRRLPAPTALTSSSQGSTAPRNQLETQLAGIWSELLGVDEVGLHDNFFHLGGHSLLAMSLLAQIEKQLGQTVSLSTLVHSPTIAGMAAAIDEAIAAGRPTSIVAVRTDGSRPPLFFLPGITGEARVNRHLLERLGPDQPVYGLGQSPLDSQTADTIESIAQSLCDDVCAVCQSGPVSLVGYSFSGVLAYEVAQQLALRGRQVQLLAIIDSGPGGMTPRRLGDRLVDLGMFIRNAPRFLAGDLMQATSREIWKRTLRKAKSLVRRAAAKWGLSPRPQQRVLSEDVFDVEKWPDPLRARVDSNLRAFSSYRYRPYPGRVTLFRARTSPLLHSYTHDLGWSKFVEDRLETRMIPGNHVSILHEPHIYKLATEFQLALEAAGSADAE